MISRRRLVAFVLVISSVVFLAVFDGLLQSLSLFCCPHLLEASRCFCQLSYKLLAIFVSCLFAVFVVSETSRYFVGCHFAVVIGCLGSFSSAFLEAFCCFCRPSWKLLTIFAGHLGSFSLPFLLFCSRPFSCCFSQPLLLFSCFFLAVLLAVLVACSSRSFLAKTFSGFPFLIGALVNIQSSVSSKRTVKRYIYSMLIVCPNYELVRKRFYVPYCINRNTKQPEKLPIMGCINELKLRTLPVTAKTPGKVSILVLKNIYTSKLY